MTIRPIIFSGPMIRALLEGRKTQTRRVLKPQPHGSGIVHYGKSKDAPASWTDTTGTTGKLPFWVGDLLYVRESFARAETGFAYMADHPGDTSGMGWKPSIHMPREASRLTLRVTDVRVQRAQDISEEDGKAEGVEPVSYSGTDPRFEGLIGYRDYSDHPHNVAPFQYAWRSFQSLWDSLNDKRGYGWDKNPWVVALTFEVHHCNVDQFDCEVAA
ncbi:hypothetical protein [Roseibium alexandrii]|uniref:hypothetical protein n=1 Tax=Roseibium alexandrii TaxID=388408 RepID=UPI003753578F